MKKKTTLSIAVRRWTYIHIHKYPMIHSIKIFKIKQNMIYGNSNLAVYIMIT